METETLMTYLSDIRRSESSPTNVDELKRIKFLISNLQDDLERSRVKDSAKWESTITDLQSRFGQMETRFDRWLKEMKEVSSICFTPAPLLF